MMLTHIHKRTHIFIYLYIYMPICVHVYYCLRVCVCVVFGLGLFHDDPDDMIIEVFMFTSCLLSDLCVFVCVCLYWPWVLVHVFVCLMSMSLYKCLIVDRFDVCLFDLFDYDSVFYICVDWLLIVVLFVLD